MSATIEWMRAAAEEPQTEGEFVQRGEETESAARKLAPEEMAAIERLPAHGFPGKNAVQEEYQEPEYEDDASRQRRIYRARTATMLRRYMRYSIETGRLPSLLGREFFRAKVTAYQVTTFEDRVIFVHDMEICLGKMDDFSREVLARIVLQEYEYDEAARLLGCGRTTVYRSLIEALDKLANILIDAKLLEG